jgi:hypothetical protein
LIEDAESTTQDCERSRPGAREDEKATYLKGVTHLTVIVFIFAVLESGHDVMVVGGDVA